LRYVVYRAFLFGIENIADKRKNLPKSRRGVHLLEVWIDDDRRLSAVASHRVGVTWWVGDSTR